MGPKPGLPSPTYKKATFPHIHKGYLLPKNPRLGSLVSSVHLGLFLALSYLFPRIPQDAGNERSKNENFVSRSNGEGVIHSKFAKLKFQFTNTTVIKFFISEHSHLCSRGCWGWRKKLRGKTEEYKYVFKMLMPATANVIEFHYLLAKQTIFFWQLAKKLLRYTITDARHRVR